MYATRTALDRSEDLQSGFTEEQVRAVAAAVSCENEAVRTRLALQIEEWSRTRRHHWLRLAKRKRLTAQQRGELLALADLAKAYIRALHHLGSEQRHYLKIRPFGRGLQWSPRRRRMASEDFSAHMRDASNIARAAQTANRGVRAGHPGNPFNKAVVVEELAQMYEAAKGTKAARRVARAAVNGEYDYGPFHEFAAAMWVATFGSRRGLSSAEKEWARLRRQLQRNRFDLAAVATLRMAEIPRLPTE